MLDNQIYFLMFEFWNVEMFFKLSWKIRNSMTRFCDVNICYWNNQIKDKKNHSISIKLYDIQQQKYCPMNKPYIPLNPSPSYERLRIGYEEPWRGKSLNAYLSIYYLSLSICISIYCLYRGEAINMQIQAHYYVSFYSYASPHTLY